MAALRDATGETVGISVALADQLLHVDQVESELGLHARLDIGRPLPLWSGAPARLLLAVRSDEEIAEIVAAAQARRPGAGEPAGAGVAAARGGGACGRPGTRARSRRRCRG